jgi:hypothetical protein
MTQKIKFRQVPTACARLAPTVTQKIKFRKVFGGMCVTCGNGCTEHKHPLSFRRQAAKEAQRINAESFFSPAQQVLTKKRTHRVIIPCCALFSVDI